MVKTLRSIQATRNLWGEPINMNLLSGRNSFLETLPNIKIEANDFSIIEKTVDYKPTLLKLIKEAKQRIYITSLYIQDDDAGKEILTAIYEAKQANPKLEIYLFVDFLRAQRGLMGHEKSIGNVRLYREMNVKYKHSIEILGVPVKSKEFLGVLHLKGFVFDDQLLYSGSSINNIYLQQNGKYRYDRYHIIKNSELANSFVDFLSKNFIKNDAVRSLTSDSIAKIKSLKKSIRKMKLALRKAEYVFKKEKFVDQSDILITPLLGFGGRKNKLNQSIVEMIRNTQESLVLFTPYFNFPSKVHKSVRRLLKKGKKVTIVVGDKTANDFYIPESESFNKVGILPYIYETSLRRFVKSNQRYIDMQLLDVCLWLDPGNSFHLKGINSDEGSYLITGHNINPRAWRLDIENGVFIQDKNKKLKSKFDSELSEILKNCNKINHFEEIETADDYRVEAKKLLRSVKRSKLDSILNRLL